MCAHRACCTHWIWYENKSNDKHHFRCCFCIALKRATATAYNWTCIDWKGARMPNGRERALGLVDSTASRGLRFDFNAHDWITATDSRWQFDKNDAVDGCAMWRGRVLERRFGIIFYRMNTSILLPSCASLAAFWLAQAARMFVHSNLAQKRFYLSVCTTFCWWQLRDNFFSSFLRVL